MTLQNRRRKLFRHMMATFLCSLLLLVGVVSSRETSSQNKLEQMEQQIYKSPFLQSLSIHDRCRLFPTWTSSVADDYSSLVSWDDCGTARSYFPQNFGLFNGSTWDFPHQDLHWMYKLQDCMQEAQEERLQDYYWNEFRMVEANDGDEEDEFDFWEAFLQRHPLHPSTVGLEYPSMEILSLQQQYEGTELVPPVAIVVEDALHIREAETLEDLKECLQMHHSRLTEIRPFGQNYDNGGNNCVFLGGFLQWLAPGVAAQIRQAGHVAWAHAHWGEFVPPRQKMHPYGYKDPLEAGIRTSGHLSYEGWEALGPHKDNDSLYTVLVMLSDPDEYDGGELYMHVDRSGEQSELQQRLDASHPPLVIKPNKYSAVVFMADENTHQVLSIGGGDRQTVGTEFWGHGDAPFGIMRPSPEMWSNYQRNQDWWNFD
ncbi:2OG-Fe(II) oxygenase superfamily-domain containing protein [Nitzschia inconspicua]|uniref:2OG-Fe(II) oxygenase superfamily-domain containing protein n=1 Tax=Nitzschia inconspicua TaxID=303405 RepID=A0A9K3KGH0_9STRA|nr:2OG-Fe(II) oxygenase superfamily-domain containing protein [Nitzschia inconspicua]